jgi:hypothetical protein
LALLLAEILQPVDLLQLDLFSRNISLQGGDLGFQGFTPALDLLPFLFDLVALP